MRLFRSNQIIVRAFAAMLLESSPCALVASDAAEKLGTPFAEQKFWEPVFFPRAHNKVHALLNFDFSDRYVTTRGLVIENQGLIFQPQLTLYWSAYSNPNGFINDVTLSAGVWNSVHTRRSGLEPSNLNETDATGGISVTFARDWKLGAYYSGYFTGTNSYQTAWNLDVSLGYDDSRLLGRFALHPYVQYSRETEGKTSVVFRPDRTDESYCLQLGINPGYQFQSIPLRVEFPTFITWVPGDYYQRSTLETIRYRYFGYTYSYQVYDGAGGGAGPGFFSTAMRLSMPLKFMPRSMGDWTGYASVQYYRFINPGLLDGNQVLGVNARRERDLVQFHAGLSIYY